MSEIFWVILAGAALTYATRIGGHLVLSRFDRIHPRVEAGLNAVPAAVLTTIIAPVVVDPDPIEITGLVVAGLVALRWSSLPMFLAGAVTVFAMRYLGI